MTLLELLRSHYAWTNEEILDVIQNKNMPRTSDGLITLAKNRGKIINTKYAEAFRLIRKTC